LAIVEEAQASSAAFITDFGNDCLPTVDNALESLSDSEPHCPSSK
jgi:hypothetical protein